MIDLYIDSVFEMTIGMTSIYLKIPNISGGFIEKDTLHEILKKITSFISKKETAVMPI